MRSFWLLAVLVIAVGACGHPANAPDAASDGQQYCSPGGAECGAGQSCVGGACVPDVCATDSPCAAGDSCTMICVPTRDRCEGVECPDGKTCVDGQCYAGCFPPSPCLAMDCADGEYCAFGTCKPLVPCSAECGAGFQCHIACNAPNPCDGISCAANEFCLQGQCIVNPCYGVECPDTQVCNAGACVATCNCPGGCGSDGECVLNTCLCAPDCTGKACGEDDGCGGECDVACPEGGQYDCRDGGGGEYACQCVPSCVGKQCGADDGCGHECNGSCPTGDACVIEGPGSYTCQCNPTCANNSSENCGDPNSCGTGFCDVEDCADSGETCDPSGGSYDCKCPVGRAECSGDCCPNASDVCRTATQAGPGSSGATGGPDSCCTAARTCTDASRNTVCCTGNGLTCLDSDNDGDTESCCTASRQCNDTTGAETNTGCCGVGETCMDTLDADSQRDQCCPAAQACGEIGTCCDTGEYCSTRPGGGNDLCCANGTTNCDGACVATCGGDKPARCNDGIAGNEVCCTSGETFCDGECAPKCPNGETQYLCGDGIAGNEECCASSVQRCEGAANSTGGSEFCCIAPQDSCFDGPTTAPTCCSDAASYCTDSGGCCPDAQSCLADSDGNAGNDVCCDAGQVLSGGACCTPSCPDPSTISCGTLDSCGYQECPGTCDASSTCLESAAGGPPDWFCQTLACNPVCNSVACYDCVGGSCDYRCDNPGYGGTVCSNGQCVPPVIQ
ncbi:MAG: hypothetical protein AB7R00_04430 [Kofleriaceae bacterium]